MTWTTLWDHCRLQTARPFFAGRGAIDARKELLALAKRIDSPLATTLRAKGYFEVKSLIWEFAAG